MTGPKKNFRILQNISPALLLPFLAGILVLVFFTITLSLSDPGSYADELGFTGDNDYVTIEGSTPQRKPLMTIARAEVKPGESFYTILAGKGVSLNQIDAISKQLKGSFSLRSFRPGQQYETTTDSTGTLKRLSYFQDRTTTIHIEKTEKTPDFVVRREVKEYETRIASLEGTVDKSLSNTLKSFGRSSLMGGIRKLFASRINVRDDVRPGTKYKILFEEKWLMNEFVSTGKILAAEFTLANRSSKAYLYSNEKGKAAYFDEQGRALEQKALFTAPCNYARISSGFGYRIHPITRTRHFHGGIDMSAASGTPVRAVADGKIVFKGTKGGAGNMVTVKHSSQYYSQYLHLSRYAPRRPNIRQGEIIGYVGSTGSSTGPHLDFRIIHNGKPMNPIAALSSSASETIPHSKMGSFLASISRMKTQFDNNRVMVAASSATPRSSRRALVSI